MLMSRPGIGYLTVRPRFSKNATIAGAAPTRKAATRGDERPAPTHRRVVVVARVGGERPHGRRDQQARQRGEERPEGDAGDEALERRGCPAVRSGPAVPRGRSRRRRGSRRSDMSRPPSRWFGEAGARSRRRARGVHRAWPVGARRARPPRPSRGADPRGCGRMRGSGEAKCSSIRSTSTGSLPARTPFSAARRRGRDPRDRAPRASRASSLRRARRRGRWR